MTTAEPLTIGTAKAIPGQLSYGTFDAVPLPTGSADRFPIVIAQGREDGPTLWVTASIHGDEPTGVAVLHKLLSDDLAAQMRGTLVAVPTLNPSGLREVSRSAYYIHGDDPNRLFPMPEAERKPTGPDASPSSVLELAYERFFEVMKASADYLIDLHCMPIGAIALSFRDPVYYFSEDEKDVATKLFETTTAMMEVFGIPIINEFGGGEYLNKKLHRSVSGAMLNTARIPSFTAELGGYLMVEPAVRDASVAGLRNVMRWAGMLDGDMEAVEGFTAIAPGYPVRRFNHPRVPCSCIVHHLLVAGDPVSKGQPVAEIRDIYGRPVGDDGLLRSEHDGFVASLSEGVVHFQNDAVMLLAIRDDSEMVLPHPSMTAPAK